ncbi:actin-like ATPase domain-containing protein [Tothia fuscella]|uniref:Actin-like ATPase domain-containing protein n=1 Tax=Tothia fuscella TaxID=1048955 RepID=A0A9P4NX78_9PEZI|nr:actin-like ATPase domain-containing protein [Tothia fuscella]
MVGKKGSRSQARAEGLQKTDNNMDVTSWPVAGMINQKNYYTEYLKRDDQYLAYRTTQEENTNRMVKEARDRDRALAQSNGIPLADPSNAIDEDTHMEGMETAGSLQEPHGSKVIVIHPGSQNLRIALANAALPKTVPMVVARKWRHNESEENGGEPKPKRVKIDNEVSAKPEEWFGEDFATKYNTESSNLKIRMKNNKRKLMPNSKELVVNFNKRTQPDVISEHNDPQRIDWTEILPGKVPEYFTGHAALRIPDQSRPRYKLFWPLRNGLFNEHDYSQSNLLLNDFFLVIEEAIKSELGLKKKKEWQDYSCCFIIPDLYERKYVTSILDGLMRDFGFKRICFMQESMAASFGAGYSMACVVDIGAQKTSLCCVEDGMCIEDSRMNLKYGGADVTEAFIKMMLFDHFPYEEINLKRRYDLLLADELKHKFCTMNEVDVAVQLYDFHLRASGQDTRKYTFKTYDEPMLAPMGYFIPTLFDHSNKLFGRHKVIDRSYDLYDGSPNDPIPVAQAAVLQYSAQNAPSVANTAPDASPAVFAASTPSKPKPYSLLNRLPQDDTESTPLSSVAGSPVPEGTPQPGRDSPAPGMAEHTNGHISDPSAGRIRAAEERDSILPIMPLDTAIMLCIKEATRGDERKMKDFFGGIMLVGGGAKVAGFNTFLETRLRERMPNYNKEIMIGLPPRELDQQLVAWKGGSVFARLSSSGNDSWIYRREYDMLGAKLLAQKLMWAF